MAEAVVCASCPEKYHDQVAEICLKHQVQKAFGKAGDMVNALSGKDWIPKWEAKVVMATVTKAQTLNTNKALILCVAGGKNCDAEMGRQPALVRAIKTEMGSQDFRVRVEWIEIEEFLERYPGEASKPSKPKAKDNKGLENGKDAKGGKSCKSDANSKGSNSGKSGANGKGSNGGSNSGKADGKDSTQSKPCNYWLEGNCKNGSGCKFLHAKYSDESGGYGKDGGNTSNKHGQTWSETPSKLCKYWLEGNCKNGLACKFLHDREATSRDGKDGKSGNSGKGVSNASSKSKEAKQDTKKVQCLACKQKFKDWPAMCQKHYFCEGRAPLCLCLECNKTFADDIDCAQHQSAKGHQGMARVNDEEEPTWMCGQCGKEFDSQRAKEQHQSSLLHGDFPVCTECHRTFPNMDALAQHQQAKGHRGHCWVVDGDSDSEPEGTWTAPLAYRCNCGMIFGDAFVDGPNGFVVMSALEAAKIHQKATGHSVIFMP